MRVRANTGDACCDHYLEGGVSAWQIEETVGQFSVNDRDDVVTIQKLLNLIAPKDGGPTIPLVEDAWIGPQTNKAILHFQRFQGTGSDGKVHPNGPTLARMNSISKQRLSARNADLLARVAGSMVDLNQMALKARRTIEGAMTYLQLPDGLFSSKRNYELANLHFDLDELSQPAAMDALRSIRTTLQRVQTVLASPPSVVTGGNSLSISIFTVDPVGHNYMAYVRVESATGERPHPDVHPGHVYLCQKIRKAVRDKFIHILMHELFHFVDDEQHLRITDHGYGEKAMKLPHKKRMGNADNYALFSSHVHFGRERLLGSQPKLGPHIPSHLH